MTEVITRPAVKVQQGKKTLFTTSFTVGDFDRQGFYRVNRLDPQGGFQRLLQETRAKRLKSYAVEAWKAGHQTFLPTSVFLATEKTVQFDSIKNAISFRLEDVCPFDVVDGQHRIEGLRLAAAEIHELRDFPVIANIAVDTSEVEQMLHFYVVNTTQRAVDPAVGMHIRARFFRMLETQTLPYIPSWIEREIKKGTDEEAIRILEFLNTHASSPWRGQIQGANERRSESTTITEKTFASALKKTILVASHPLKFFDETKRKDIFLNYWMAVENVFTDSNTRGNTVVFKAMGALFFCRLSAAVISRANFHRSYCVEDFEKIFKSTESYVPSDSVAMLTPEWWESGGGASGMNAGAVEKKAVEFSQAVMSAEVDQDGNI